MSTHESPSGFTFTLRKPEHVPERLRRPVQNQLTKVSAHKDQMESKTLTPEALQDFDELNDLTAVALLSSWSAEAPINRESLIDLPSQDYKAIREAVAPFVWDLFPDFTVNPDAESPTAP